MSNHAVSSPFGKYQYWTIYLQAKALTIGKLMEIAPVGTVDPTPFIYDSTMYTMAGLMVSDRAVTRLLCCTSPLCSRCLISENTAPLAVSPAFYEDPFVSWKGGPMHFVVFRD